VGNGRRRKARGFANGLAIIVAHPDDETVGAGSLTHRLRDGWRGVAYAIMREPRYPSAPRTPVSRLGRGEADPNHSTQCASPTLALGRIVRDSRDAAPARARSRP